MNSLLTKLTALLGEDYKAQKGLSRAITFLRDELSSMNSLLEKLAGMETLDPQVREWRNQVREMAYDMEDYIDKAIWQIQELKARIIVASQRRDRYKLDEVVVGSGSKNVVAIDPRLPALYVEATNLVGVDGPSEDLIRLVTDEDLSNEDYAITEQSNEESLINALRDFLKDKRLCDPDGRFGEKVDS
nr:unnamed protein product [Digitaria exilis]